MLEGADPRGTVNLQHYGLEIDGDVDELRRLEQAELVFDGGELVLNGLWADAHGGEDGGVEVVDGKAAS